MIAVELICLVTILRCFFAAESAELLRIDSGNRDGQLWRRRAGRKL